VEGVISTQALSIRPQDPSSLVGVLTASFLHGSLGHLGANAFAVLTLGTLAGTVFPRATARALPLIWLGSGLGTWLIGTGGSHLGASGITHGLGFLVFGLGILRRDRQAIAASLIAFFFFGGMLVTVFPTEIGVSWEYHLAGAVSGLLGALLFRRADPAPPR
jgi:membrane associated rhomboid family serine protease